ncbi:MAG: GTP cyclohydrolase II [Acetobacteraceae bacterium]
MTEEVRAAHALRRVHRAASELRRGVPVILSAPSPLLLLGAETASPATVAEVGALTQASPVLLLSPARAAAILRAPMLPETEVAAVAVAPSLLAAGALQKLPDPTLRQPAGRDALRPAPVPPEAIAAFRLAKIAQMLPAVLAAPLPPDYGAAAHDLVEVSAEDVLAYPEREAACLKLITSVEVPLTDAPDSRVVAFRADGSAIEHLAIVIGRPEEASAAGQAPLVRIHSECFTGDLLGSMRCDCGPQLRGAISRIAEDGAGVVLYLGQEGRGIGLVNKLRAYRLQDQGLDTMDANRALGWGADERSFMIGGTMLRAMGLTRVRLLTNNPDKIAGLAACGIEVVGREAHRFEPNGVNDDYLATKAARFGHMLD